MRFGALILTWGLGLLLPAFATLRADTGDVDSSHDYPGWPRVPGFIISDYDEDNPAEFDFPLARPMPIDAAHVDIFHVKGHRYAIRYEPGAGGHALSVYQTQKYYEKIAAANGYTVEKSGATGDVTETFHHAAADHDVWVYLEPAGTFNVLTVVESAGSGPPPPGTPIVETPGTPTPAIPAVYPPSPMYKLPPSAANTTPVAAVPATAPTLPDTAIAQSPLPDTIVAATSESPAQKPAPSPTPTEATSSDDTTAPDADSIASPAPPPEDPTGESLYSSLSDDGRVIVPFVFRSGKDDVAPVSQPLVDRIAAMMKNHPDLALRIEGHTDNTGDSDANLRLSAERALSVEAKLVDDHVDKKRLDAVGVGGLQPLVDNDTPEGRATNRRIELVMWKKYPAFHSATSDPTFHPPAPNGNNYYPSTSSSDNNSRAGL